MSARALIPALTITLLFLLSGPAVSADADSGRNPAAPDELEALAFLVGDWDLDTSFEQPDGSRRQARARLSARYALGGYGISVEETHPYELGDGGSFVSAVLYTVHPESRRIVGASNNTLGNRKHYDVTVEADRILIHQSGELFAGREGSNRLVFSGMTEDRYEMRLDSCDTTGQTCEEGTYSYVAHRRETAAAATDGQAGRELDFFIGDWDVRIVDRNETTIARARTSARFIMDGTAIQDDWTSLDPAGNVVFRGTSIRTYVPATKQWVVHWVMANTPGYTYIDAVWTKGELHGTGTGFDGRGEFQERYRYFDITAESYSFSLERTYDGGETWEPQPQLRAEKIEGT